MVPVAFPDAVDLILGWLSAQASSYGLTGVAWHREVPKTRPARFVTVIRTGGPRQTIVSEQAQLTISAWATTPADTADLARTTRALINAAEREILAGTPIYRVSELAGPGDLPDPDVPSHHRHTWTVLVHLRGAALTAS